MVLIDLGETGPTGKLVQDVLADCNIVVNRNTVPRETRKPFVTSGIRLGTPALTTRGMEELEMEKIGTLVSNIIKNLDDVKTKKEVTEEVIQIASSFPTP